MTNQISPPEQGTMKELTVSHQTPSPTELSLAKKEQTIFDYFDPQAEIEFLSRIEDKEARSLYGRESLLKTLAEFAGEIPFDQIDFYFDGQNLHHPQVGKLVDNFSENDPRERADLSGLRKIEADLRSGANISFWVSPPTPGDARYGNYSFLWVMVRDPQHPGLVREHIFRYDEQGKGTNNFNNFARSSHVFTGILTQMARFPEVGADPAGMINIHNEKDFLRTPLSFRVDDPEKILDPLIFSLFGRKMAELGEERKVFYEKILSDPLIKLWSNQYLNYVDWLADSENKGSPPTVYQPVYDYIQVIFNRARAIVRGEVGAYEDNDCQSLPVAAAFDEYMEIVPGVDGGSCPTSSPSSSPDPTDNILRKVRVGGIPLSKLGLVIRGTSQGKERTLHCHCGLCGAEVDATISGGKIHCPACGGEAPYEC